MLIFINVFLFFSYIYEDSDSLLVVNDSLVICGYHQYNRKVHLVNNAKLKVQQWNGIDSTGRVILQAPFIYIHNSMIDGSGKGYSGGTNTHPDGYGPGCGYAGTGGGGGGGAYGGAGGDGGDLDPGAGGSPYGNLSDTVINMGSGGGAGRLGLVDGFGGNGGALIYLKGQRMIIDSSQILSLGLYGYDGGYEAGGGGSGGGIKMQADTLRIRYSSVLASGGAGGNADGGGGGGGGGGRIKGFFAILDTNHLSLSVSGGAGGYGGYGNGEDGSVGTIFFGPLVVVEENIVDNSLKAKVQSLITKGRLNGFFKKNPDKILIYNIMGRLVKIGENTENEIDVSDLKNGVYFLKLPGEKKLMKFILIK